MRSRSDTHFVYPSIPRTVLISELHLILILCPLVCLTKLAESRIVAGLCTLGFLTSLLSTEANVANV